MTTHIKKMYLLFLLFLGLASCTSISDFFVDLFTPTPDGEVPSRPLNAVSGSKFIRSTFGLSKEQREQMISREILRGNIPDFLRKLKPVKVSIVKNGKVIHRGIVWVMPDYLAIGSDSDFIRIPMNPLTAQRIADAFGFMLPTTKLVDEIYNQADKRLRPAPLPAGPQMVSSMYYAKHDKMVNQQIKRWWFGNLLSGHKKDIVITNRLLSKDQRVAIYGWHLGVGRPIQPLSTVHGITYADYSHGVRLVYKYMTVDNEKVPVINVLRSETLAPLISNEGVIKNPRTTPLFVGS